jgi:hypothetical protein
MISNRMWKQVEKEMKPIIERRKKLLNGDLLSNCCAWEFEPLGYEKEEGVWQERCLKCGKLCEPIFISKRDIENIHRCIDWNNNNGLNN